MRILVTGGAGFLGSHLCAALLAQDHEVICLDNFFAGQKQNIQDLFSNPNFELIRHDVVDPIKVQVDQIYHLACPASPVFYQYDPVETMKTAVIGTMNLLQLALSLRSPILLTSTSEVYGDPLIHPQNESYWGNVNPNGIRSCYDEGKRAAEALAFDFNRMYGVEIRVARLFNSYGPHMMKDDGRVVSNFVVQALQGKDITVYGDGSQTRSFCYYKDTINGLVALMNSDCLGPVNIGRPVENTVLELAKLVIEKTNSSSKIVFKPLPQDDPVRRLPDISLAKEKLNWEPVVSLEEGIEATIAYFKHQLDNNLGTALASKFVKAKEQRKQAKLLAAKQQV